MFLAEGLHQWVGSGDEDNQGGFGCFHNGIHASSDRSYCLIVIESNSWTNCCFSCGISSLESIPAYLTEALISPSCPLTCACMLPKISLITPYELQVESSRSTFEWNGV